MHWRESSVLRNVGATITKVVVLLAVVPGTGIVVAVIAGFVFVKRKDLNMTSPRRMSHCLKPKFD
jgi:hypothetical protein